MLELLQLELDTANRMSATTGRAWSSLTFAAAEDEATCSRAAEEEAPDDASYLRVRNSGTEANGETGCSGGRR